MKKLFIVVCFVLIAVFPIFCVAFDENNREDWETFGKRISSSSFKPTIHDRTSGFSHILWDNPAELADKKFRLQAISTSVSGFNCASLLKNAGSDIANINHGNADKTSLVNIGETILENLGKGYNSIAEVDMGMGVQIAGFALGYNLKVGANTYGESAGLSNISATAQADWALSLGYGLGIFKNDDFTLNLGAVARFAYRGLLKPINAQIVADDLDNGADDIFDSFSTAIAGFAIPFDVGISAGFLNNTLKAELTVNNINGNYKMNRYDSFEDALKMKNKNVQFSQTNGTVKIKTLYTVNTGVVWTPKIKVISPMLAIDIYDIIGMIQNKKLFVQNIGLLGSISVASILDLKVGIDRGYWQFGAGLGFNANKIEIFYGFHEFGKKLADKPVDKLTIQCKFGWEAK